MGAIDGYVIRNAAGAYLKADRTWSTPDDVTPAVHTAEQLRDIANASAVWAIQPSKVWRAALLGGGRVVHHDATPRSFIDESKRLRALVGSSSRGGAMGVSAASVHAALPSPLTAALAKAINHEHGIVDFGPIAKLMPDTTGATAEAWHVYEEALAAVADALRSETTQLIVCPSGVAYARGFWVSTLERDLRRSWVDPVKARVIARAAEQCFAGRDEVVKTTLHAALQRYASFIGARSDNARRILLQQPVVLADPELRQDVEAFINHVAVTMRTLRNDDGPTRVSADTVAILTRDGGGAHISIARTLDGALRNKLPTKQVNLSVKELPDPLEQTLGLRYADTYNTLFQQAGRKRAADLAQEINAVLLEFIPSRHFDYLRRETGAARVVVSTTHWREDVALVAEHDTRVLLQICDYGELNDNLREVADAVFTYDLQGIEFLLPGDDALGSLSPSAPRDHEAFKVRDYPVDAAWETPPDAGEVARVREAHGVRTDARLATVMAGLHGVGAVLGEAVHGIVTAHAAILAAGESLPATDVLMVCGTNVAMRLAVRAYAADTFDEAGERFALSPMERQTLRESLRIVPVGMVPNSDLAVLVRDSDAVVTKPGGRTTAELIAAGVPRPIVAYDGSHPWERPNLDAMTQRLGATVVSEMKDVGDAIRARMQAVLPPVPMPRRGSVIDRILEVYAQRS